MEPPQLNWIANCPVIGALGVGSYAYYDTGQVARTEIGLFEQEIEIGFNSRQRL